jgi:hypothetical protein
MPEIKNTFIKSKMNSDLDARLLANNEYRDALNISVSQSEGEGVGSLETVLGNALVEEFSDDKCNTTIIGYYTDENTASLYVFITNFIDSSVTQLTESAPDTAICEIWRKSIDTGQKTKLVEGAFLNFAINSNITGVNLIEDLLFWTDNRNQPRKINVDKANPANSNNPTYYSNEDQISVAKYYPSDTIQLYKEYVIGYSIIDDGCSGGCSVISPSAYLQYAADGEVLPTTTNGEGNGMTIIILTTSAVGEIETLRIDNPGIGYSDGDRVYIAPRSGSGEIELEMQVQSTMKDTCSEFLPNTFTIDTSIAPTTITSGAGFAVTSTLKSWYVGSKVKLLDVGENDVTPANGAILSAVGPSTATVEWVGSPTTIDIAQVVVGVNPDYQSLWPGDCNYLKDKFVRFSYRFQFDDGEYSLIAPFTQPCFIPQQNGYFMGDFNGWRNDQRDAYNNTTLEFFENMVTNVDLVIPCPKFLWNNLGDTDDVFANLREKMHVENIEIVYKDDNELTYKIVDTISFKDFSQFNVSTYIYSYQSTQPYRVLPESETTRVSDAVPIRAFTQEVAGNRVIYGNYVDKPSGLESLDYEVSVGVKEESNLLQEYQNHTVKQNRIYQVGIVLADRYGRQSDVILSTPRSETDIAGQSRDTITNPFKTSGFSSSSDLIQDASPYGWFGDALKVTWNNIIPTNSNTIGYPGIFEGYSTQEIQYLYGGQGYPLGPQSGIGTTGGSGVGMTVSYQTDQDVKSGPSAIGTILSVEIDDPGEGYEQYDVITINGASGPGHLDATFIYNPQLKSNILGWYSYKIVVKQQQQEYYNVYLPGIVNGLLSTAGSGSSNQASISLYGDNVNKVPKDQTDIVPGQKTYSSTTDLVLRVNNITDNNEQFYPNTTVENITSLGELSDLGIPLDRYSQECRVATALNAYLQLEGYNDNIQPGMAVTSISNTGVPKILPSDGLYVQAYYADAASAGDTKVTLNDVVPASGSVLATDIITFSPPGIIYNAQSNPLIGVLATTTAIGVKPDANFTVNLAVAETNPVESNLNIYWETSSTGLVSTLNNNIVGSADVNTFANISPISINFSEEDPSGTTISNSFHGLDYANNALIDPNTTCLLVSVRDNSISQSNRTNEFELITSGSGDFSIRTVGEFYCGSDPGKYTFTFNVLMIIQGKAITKQVTGVLDNVKPFYTNSSGTPIPPPEQTFTNVSWGRETAPDCSHTQINNYSCLTTLYGRNGSVSSTQDQNEVVWTIASAKIIEVEDVPIEEIACFDDEDMSFIAAHGCIECGSTAIAGQLCLNKDVRPWFVLQAKTDTFDCGDVVDHTIATTGVAWGTSVNADNITSTIEKGVMLTCRPNLGMVTVDWEQVDGFGLAYHYADFWANTIYGWNGNNWLNPPGGDFYLPLSVLCKNVTVKVLMELQDGTGDIVSGAKFTVKFKNS